MTQGELHLKFWTEKGQRRSFVYVIQGNEGSPVKVGIARDPLKRMATLQTGSWETLRLLHAIPGGRQQEAEFHARLRDAGCQVAGEWFQGPAVEEFLKEIHDTAEQMVEAAKGSVDLIDVTPGVAPGTNQPEPVEVTQARWRRISGYWLGGEDRRTIRLREDLTETQLEIEILRMRENGYELAEGLVLLEGDDRPLSRAGNFRKLGVGQTRTRAA